MLRGVRISTVFDEPIYEDSTAVQVVRGDMVRGEREVRKGAGMRWAVHERWEQQLGENRLGESEAW